MKDLNAAWRNTRQKKLKSLNLNSILPMSAAVGQCQISEKLIKAIQRRALTESLEILSEYGFDGDLGIIAIRCAEDLGRTAR